MTAARRARKKANKLKGLKGWSDEVMLLTPTEAKQVEEALAEEPATTTTTTESEHAAALAALAKVKRMRNRKACE